MEPKKSKKPKPFKRNRITLEEIRRAVNADKPAGIFRPIKRG